jgi:hypothetical protein
MTLKTNLLRTAALILLLGVAPLAACAEIHPDNTPFSPMGRGGR